MWPYKNVFGCSCSHSSEENKFKPRLQPKWFMPLTFLYHLSPLHWRKLLISRGKLQCSVQPKTSKKGSRKYKMWLEDSCSIGIISPQSKLSFLSKLFRCSPLRRLCCPILDNCFSKKKTHRDPKHSCHLCVGSCFPRRNVSISASPSSGLLRGTKWPAPLIVTIVIPWYSTNLPATCLFRYQGCHCVLIGRPRASTQYRDPITGTLPSASPL